MCARNKSEMLLGSNMPTGSMRTRQRVGKSSACTARMRVYTQDDGLDTPQSTRTGEHSTGCKGACCSYTKQLAKWNMQTLVSTGSLFALLAHYLKLAACRIFLERILDCTYVQLYGNCCWKEQDEHCDWIKCPLKLRGEAQTMQCMQQTNNWKLRQYCRWTDKVGENNVTFNTRVKAVVIWG